MCLCVKLITLSLGVCARERERKRGGGEEGREEEERREEGKGEKSLSFGSLMSVSPTQRYFPVPSFFCTLPPTLVPDLTRSERVETAATAAGILITGKGGGRACTTAPDDRIASCGWYGRTLSWLPMHRVFWREKKEWKCRIAEIGRGLTFAYVSGYLNAGRV